MSDLISEPQLIANTINSIKDLCKVGHFKSALAKAEDEWGAIETWNSHEKLLVAVRLYMNLGGDRKSDAILLRLWRKNPNCPELLNKILFYKLNKLGPILTNELMRAAASQIVIEGKNKSDFLGFTSIIQRIFKNYSKADTLLDEAIFIDPSDNWLTSLKIQLLNEQNEDNLAQQLAQKHFDAYPSPYNMRVLSNILTKNDGIDASIEMYELFVNKFQSAQVWFEYAQLLAGRHLWEKCQYAIKQFEYIRIVKDKRDEQVLLSWKGQIAIHFQEIDNAINYLSDHKSRYWKIVTENLKKSKGELNRKVLDVPFLKQEHMTCAPTTLAALCRYWGKYFDSKEIADVICFDGTPATKERQWLLDNDFCFKEFELDAELAYELIEHDIPFALVTTSGFSAHLQAVIGFNKQVGTLYVMDPSQSMMQEMLTKETIAREAYSGARCIAFVPLDQYSLLSPFRFPAADLYPLWDSYSRAEEKNDYFAAKKAVEELKEIDYDHRITQRVERSFALWNNDISNVLELNNKLLKKFPNETLLLDSKYFCLRDLGRRDEGLTLLSNYLHDTINLDLLGTLFDQICDTNSHRELTEKSLSQLKEFGGYSAYSHWSIANYYWSHQSFEIATEHYLYAYCLDETNSNYIESYFKASRYLKNEEASINFLKLRFNKYKVRSAVPAITLYKAYELLDQEHIGIDYLFEALAIHPNDTHLIKYLSNKLIDSGLIGRYQSIETQIKATIDARSFKELTARKNQKLGEFESALLFFEQSFNENPFIHKYANHYFSLLLQRGDTAKIDEILEILYNKNSQNSQVLDYIADWHNDPFFQEKVLTEFVKLRPDYSIIRRQLIDVRLTLGMFEQALSQAKETCENIVGEHLNQSYLAKCYLKLGHFEEARALTKQVLSKSVDNDLAFFTLIEASITQDEKERSLAYVFDEMQNQIIFGDSAWNYWFEAKSILTQAKLKEFIIYLLNNHDRLWYTYSLAASYYTQYDDLVKARETLLKGRLKFPLTPRIYSDLGRLHELEGDISKSIEANAQALIMNPAWADVTKRQCELLEKHESLQAAIDVLSKGIKHNPNDGILYGYLADLLIKSGKKEEAVKALTNAVQHSNGYRWAWNELITLCNQLDLKNYPRELAQDISQRTPYLASVWRDLAYVTDEHDEKLALYDRSLGCDLYCIPAYQDKAQYYVDRGEYKQALCVLDNTPWQDKLPIELTILKVDLLVSIGQLKSAIEDLKQVLFHVHGYAYLWKKLFDLLEHEGNKQEFIACSHKSVKQNRHDPDVLCYAGENLLKHGNESEKETAHKYLSKAFELSPNEQYIVMTYVDSLIESQKFEAALSAINLFEQRKTISYATTRKITALCELKRNDEALAAFKQGINNKESDYWCLNQSFNYLNKTFSFDKLTLLFKEQVNNLTREQCYFYTDKCLHLENNNEYKEVLKEIDAYPNGEHWVGAFLALLEFWNEKQIPPPEQVIAKYFERIIQIPVLVATLGNGYTSALHYHSMIKLIDNTPVKQDLPAYVFYHYRLALQMLDRWDEATIVIQQGIQHQPDNTVHNMRLWFAYDLIRTGGILTTQDLEVIDYDELIENERYIYSTLLVVLALGNNALEDALEKLTPLLRKCQQDYQATAGQKLAMHARLTLKSRLKGAIQTKSFLGKLRLTWWINHRF